MLEIGGESVRVEVFSMILCWSRQQFLRAYLDQKRPTLLWGHVAAFRYFEGLPWKIVYDRQSTITPFEIDVVPFDVGDEIIYPDGDAPLPDPTQA